MGTINNNQQNLKISTTVITGFLGAGKTSLIKHLISTAGGRRLAFIINEFGELGVDRELLLGCGIENCTDDDVVELANGCICCTVADDFLPTMQGLLDRSSPPDHIIIETSGLALPKPLIKAFAWPEVRTRVTVDGVITVVDSVAVASGLFAHDPAAVKKQRLEDDSLDHESPLEELFEEQIQCADMIILNKAESVDDEAWQMVESAVAQHQRPKVKTVRASHGQIDSSILLGLGVGAECDLESRRSHHDGNETHDHEDFESFTIELNEISDLDYFLSKLSSVIAEHEILRVKGFLSLPGKSMRLVLQSVGGRIQQYFDRDWREDETPSSQLVIIGLYGLQRSKIESILNG